MTPLTFSLADDVPLALIVFIAALGIGAVLFPGTEIAYRRWQETLLGNRPVKGHVFWSKGFVRFWGVCTIGLAVILTWMKYADRLSL